MNNLKLFIFEDQQVRTLEIAGEIHFVAKDVAEILGYSNPLKAVRDHCKGVNEMFVPSSGGMQKTNTIKESDVYRLIIKSKLPSAERFENWVMNEVLPSIRKHGAYMTPDALQQAVSNPDFMIGLLENLKSEQQKRQQAELVIEQQKPKVIFADAVAGANNSILIADLAKLLKQNGVEIGAKRLFEWLRENGYLGKAYSHKNKPTQKAMELGLFTIKETPVFHNSGSTSVSITPKVTGKGQQYFINKFLRKGEAM